MATETIESVAATNLNLHSAFHPFAPLSADEIRHAGDLLRGVWPANTDIYFKAITLEEPPKSEVLAFLEAEHNGSHLPSIARKAFVPYYLRRTVRH